MGAMGLPCKLPGTLQQQRWPVASSSIIPGSTYRQGLGVCARPLVERRGSASREFRIYSGGEAEVVGKEEPLTVEETLEQAFAAAEDAQQAVEKVTSLPSAYPDPLVVQFFKKNRSKISDMLIILVFVVSHYFGGLIQCIGGAVGAIVISASAYKKSQLSLSGAWAAWFVGFGTMASSARCGITLLAFFFSSSKLTKWKQGTKKKLDAEFKSGGQRDWKQVLANGFIPMILAVSCAAFGGLRDLPLDLGWSKPGTFMITAFLGYYSCCCGDTWASEVGIVSKSSPRLITTGKPVRKGTNGGVTLLGLAASAAGGLFVGIVFFLSSYLSPAVSRPLQLIPRQWPVVLLGLMGGIIGSVIDSILGATVQYSGFDLKLQKVVNYPGDPDQVLCISGANLLNNNQVNLASASLTALLVGCIALRVF